MNNLSLKQKIVAALMALVAIFGGSSVVNNLGAGGEYRTAPTFYIASSTAFTLTNTSQRLLASSTPTKRLAATIQPVNCTLVTGGLIYMKTFNDAPAVAATGIAAFGSSTLALGDYPNTPVVQGSVQGITAAGTCTVLVTEWRSQNQ